MSADDIEFAYTPATKSTVRYSVRQQRNGKSVVVYQCPKCSAPLESPLSEAGSVFPCPTCRTTIKTPGRRELDQQLAAAKQKREAAQQLSASAAVEVDLLPSQAPSPPPSVSPNIPQYFTGASDGARPNYPQILRGAAMLNTVAWCALVVGIISCAGAWMFALSLLWASGRAGSNVGFAFGVGIGLGGLIQLGIWYGVFVVLRLIAACAIAHRDIARNSFDARMD